MRGLGEGPIMACSSSASAGGITKLRLCGYNFPGFSALILPSYFTWDLLGWECPRWLLLERTSSCWLPTGSHSIAPSRLAKWLASGSPPSWFHAEEAGPVAVSCEVWKNRGWEEEEEILRKRTGRGGAELNGMEKIQEDLRETLELKRKNGERGWWGSLQVLPSWTTLS